MPCYSVPLLKIPFSSPAQAPQFVANIFRNHSTFLKMVAEEGGPSQNTLNALVWYTHKTGHVSTTYATTIATYNQAIMPLTDSIQHVPVDSKLTTAMAQTTLQQSQFVTPTCNVFPYILQIPGGSPSGSYFSNILQNAAILYKNGVPILVGTDSLLTLIMLIESSVWKLGPC